MLSMSLAASIVPLFLSSYSRTNPQSLDPLSSLCRILFALFSASRYLCDVVMLSLDIALRSLAITPTYLCRMCFIVVTVIYATVCFVFPFRTH